MSVPLSATPTPSFNPSNFCAQFHCLYTIVSLLGSGSSGVVYHVTRARPDGLDREHFAIKVCSRAQVERCQRMIKFRTEFRKAGLKEAGEEVYLIPMEGYVLARLKGEHKGMIELEDIFADERYYYFVLELFGCTWRYDLAPSSPKLAPEPIASSPPSTILRSPALYRKTLTNLCTVISGGPTLSENAVKSIFRQIVEVVLFLRQRGFAHCDLKPKNILLAFDYRVKLADFGSCVRFKHTLSDPTSSKPPQGRTESFQPPEMLKEPSERYQILPAEVWSLGVLLHVMLARTHPFESVDDAKMGKRVERVQGGWSDEVEEVIEGCLTVEVGERWTMEQVADCDWLNPL